MNPIHVIGIGQGKEDLTQRHLDIIKNADVLVGGRRHLNMFPNHPAETLLINKRIDQLIDKIIDRMLNRRVVVLASGDPLFHGIGSTLVTYIDKKHIRIHSNISSVSAAFAAIQEPWHDAKVVSLHGKSPSDFSFSSLVLENKVAFLTGPGTDPAYIAGQMIQEGLFGFKFCVLENLGYAQKEKITWFENYPDVINANFAHPNIVILLRYGGRSSSVPHETHIGMDDHLFQHGKGLITKAEIRSISLSKLKLLKKDHILWDLGAGSGSISIEASFELPWGHVYAVEKNSERITDIIHNIRNFNRSNIKVLNLDFPKGIEELKQPDRIFIGGGGKDLASIMDACCEKLKETGIIVVNTVLIQNMEKAFSILEKKQYNPEMVQVQVSRSQSMPYGSRLAALNPVWIISGTKPKGDDSWK